MHPRRGLEIVGRREPVEELAVGLCHAEEHPHRLLLRRGVLERPGVERVVAGVADQLLDDSARLLVAAPDVRRLRPHLSDPVVGPREVEVERLRGRPVRLRLDELGVRREAARRLRADEVRRVDHRLSVPAGDRRERVRDCAARNRNEHGFRARYVAAVLADPRHLVTAALPAVRQAAADIPLPHDCDLHDDSLVGFLDYSCAEYAFAAMAREYPSVLELVGNTPIVRLDAVGRGVRPRLVAKLEYLNPGGSVKDRIGLAMIEKAEREGKLKPGGTIVEPTSGNTGVGLAIAAAQKGYRCIFVMPDKMSQEKISMLRAYGAEVVICPTAVEPDSPESYYSVSDRLAEEIPGGFKPDQYSNMSNPDAHYHVTGPEIWEQTGGELDAIVISVGTGGTISGVGRYFKEHNPDVRIVGVDPEGSVYTAEDERGVHPYLVEGIGKDTWPKTMDPSVVDEWVRVSDRDSFLTARRLAREEGLLVGGSGGTTVWAALDIAQRFGPEATILTMIFDSGRSYMSKFYDDNWMLEHGFVERRVPPPTVSELLRAKRAEETEVPALVTIAAHQKVGEAIDVMQRYSISQLPVVRDGSVHSLADVIGSLQDRDLLDRVFKNPDALHEDVAAAMQPPLAAVDAGQTLDEVFATLTGRTNAVVVASDGKPVGVLTRSDLLEYLAHQRQTS